MNSDFKSGDNEDSCENRRPLVLILALSDLSRDPRVMRQIAWLKDYYSVVAAGFFPPQDRSVAFAAIGPKETCSVVASKSLTEIKDGLGVRAAWGGALAKLRAAAASIPLARLLWRGLKRGFVRASPPRVETVVLPSPTGVEQESASEARASGDVHADYFSGKLKTMGDYSSLAGLCPDLILANDLDCLVLADLLFRGVRVVFDAHEYAPLEYNSHDDFWLNHEQPARIWACETFLPRVSGMSTVCQGIAAEFRRNFAVPVAIEVITNSPSLENLTPHPTGQTIRIVHHGIGAPIRKIELMAEAVRLLGTRFELYLILVDGDQKYIQQLKTDYMNCSNIKFLPPVPMPAISRFISQFDMGMFILEPEIFNYEWALPNKFFEFIQGRLAIAVGPSREMAKIVIEHDLGVVAADFSAEAMVEALQSLDPLAIDGFKEKSHRCASLFSAESNKEKMLAIVMNALSTSRPKEEA